MQRRRSQSPEESSVREQRESRSPRGSPEPTRSREQSMEASESPDRKEVACQTDDEGSTKARVRNLLAHLRSAGHAGGSVIENSVVEFKVPDGLVLIRKTERFLSRHGELVESITEEIKKEPETHE